MTCTEAQQTAIAAEGNALVAAGAGAGKTSTLVQRCARRLLDPQYRAGLDQILMVTFTEAAAAEMRARVRKNLEEVIASNAPEEWAGQREHAEEQLALLDAANICTLHSFCLKLVRQHFHELEIDPQIAVLDETQAALLIEECLDEALHGGTAAHGETAQDVQRLIQNCGGGREEPIRSLIQRLHHYAQTLPNPQEWLAGQAASFNEPEPKRWREWLLEALLRWHGEWRAKLPEAMRSKEKRKQEPWDQLTSAFGAVAEPASLADFENLLERLPRKEQFGRGARPADEFFEETGFLAGLATSRDGADPLSEDWAWARGDMAALLRIVGKFAMQYGHSKREQGAIDFHDLEQFALRLLRDPQNGAPTKIALALQKKLRFVFVDECQDINAAQDAILRALSADDQPNRFLVGDIKQSIYRFRLADPRIFQQYQREWSGGRGGAMISLQENFRSREGLIDFFNAVFSDLMRQEVGGVEFDERARLIFGAPDERAPLAARPADPRVHLHLFLTERRSSASQHHSEEEEEPAPPDHSAMETLNGTELEARLVASELKRLREGKHQIWDGGSERDVEWRDMAVLLRSPGSKVEIYAREFARQQIPLATAANNFFESIEVMDLINILTLLDNPLQDVPLLAALHSPLAGLTTDELAQVRLSARNENFWTALKVFHALRDGSAAWRKTDRFLERFARWRRMGRDASLSSRLYVILTETSYMDWLRAQADNPERAALATANVQRLLTLAEQFDPFQRQGLTRFLRFVEAQQQTVAREPVAAAGNAVQLISIHRSKGLEYPVVVLPDLAKKFNTDDLTANVLIDSKFGLCPKVRAPHLKARYPSLPHWLSARNEQAELLGEELRLLYVAMTRARDTLLLVGSTARSTAEKWGESNTSCDSLLHARSMLAWLGPWFVRNAGSADWLSSDGATDLFSWSIHESNSQEGEEDSPASAISVVNGSQGNVLSLAALASECSRVAKTYAHEPATRQAAKASVSSLRRKMLESMEEARRWAEPPRVEPARAAKHAATGLTPREIGIAHHTFLEFAELSLLSTPEGIRGEASKLVEAGALTEEEARHLDLGALTHFWSGEIGQRIMAAQDVRRELAFTARFECSELAGLGLAASAAPKDEFIVVQGVADVAVLLEREIWLLDFKTDDVSGPELKSRIDHYRPQLAAYAAALERIYPTHRVTRRWLHFLSARQTVEV